MPKGPWAGWFLVLPLLLVGPALLPSKGFLPQHPASLAPLSLEDPARAAAAGEAANLWTSDALFPFLTDARHMGAAVAAGSLPNWNPDLGLGYPSAAGSLICPWYPPNLLHLVLDPARAFGWLALLHLLLLGWGSASFLRSRGVGLWGALLAGIAVQSAGLTLLGAHYGMKLAAVTWFPWCLLAVGDLLAGRERAGLRLTVFTALSFLAGFPPLAVFGLGAVVVASLAQALGRPNAGRLWPLCGFLLLGLAGAGVALVPTYEAAHLAQRATNSATDLLAQTPPSAALGTLLAPGMFGLPGDPFFAPHHPLALWFCSPDEAPKALIANGLEWNLHMGVGVCLLALAALCGRPRRAALPLLLLLLTLGFGLGWVPMRWLYSLPGLDLGSPTRALLLTPLLWAWLAGLGFEALARRSVPALVGAGLGCLLALGLGLHLGRQAEPLADGTARSVLAERHGVDLDTVDQHLAGADLELASTRLASESRWLIGFTLAGVLATLCTWLLARREAAGAARPMALAALPWLALMGTEGWQVGRASLAPRDLSTALFPSSPAMEAVRLAAGDGRVIRLDRSASGVAEVERLARPNLLQAYGIADLTPFVVFTPRSLVEALADVDPLSGYRSGISRLSDPAYLNHRLLDVLRVTCVLATEAIEHDRLEHVFGIDGFHVHRRSLPATTEPLAQVFPATAAQTDGEQGLLFPPLIPQVSAPGDWTAGEILVDRPSPTRLDLRVTGSSGGWLVMSEGFYPGWKATVNGEDEDLVRAQGLLRALPIPAGDSVVRTKYEPTSLRLGTTLSLLALLTSWFVTRRKRD